MEEVREYCDTICFVKDGIGKMIKEELESYFIVAYQQEPILEYFEPFFDK